MRRRARGTAEAGSLTSLLDVLFILVFAALVGGRSADGEAAAALDPPPDVPAPPPVPAPPASFTALRAAAAATIADHVERAPLVIAHVDPRGVLTDVEVARERRPLGAALLEPSADPDVGVSYAGERDAALRICAQLTRALGRTDLAGHVVVIAPNLPLAQLPVALVSGLRRDVDRCPAAERALAVLVEPDPVPQEVPR